MLDSATFLYAPHGASSQHRYGNNLYRQIFYNSRLQMSDYIDLVNNDPGSELVNATLDWGGANNNGNLRGATYNNGGPGYPQFLMSTQSYGYDNVNRLKSASDTGGWSRDFCSDAYGKVWVTANSGVPLAGNTPQMINGACPSSNTPYDANNRINGGSYDAAGNQTVVNGSALVYDAESRLVSETDGVTRAVETFAYDGDGRRISKTSASATTIYVHDALGQLAAEYSTTNSSFPCGTCYLSADHLGSTRLVTDSAAKVIGRHDYLPFGEEIDANTAGRDSHWGPGNDTVNQKFTGKERDQETGLDYFGARYYGAALGRFTSPDEFKGGIVDPFTGQDIEANTALPYADITDPQTLNKYAYVRNNPVRYTDPSGHCIEDLCIGEGALVYAGYTALAGATAAYLASPSGQQAIQATGQLIQSGLNGIQNLITLATGNNSQQAQPPPAIGETGHAQTDAGSTPKEGVYSFPDATAPGKTYVGQSGNIPQRLSQHENSGKLAPGTDVTTQEVPGGKTSRELAEQQKINSLGGTKSQPGSQSSNIRNPVSPQRLKKLLDGSDQ